MSPFYLLFVLRGDNTRVGGQEGQDTRVGEEGTGVRVYEQEGEGTVQGFGRGR